MVVDAPVVVKDIDENHHGVGEDWDTDQKHDCGKHSLGVGARVEIAEAGGGQRSEQKIHRHEHFHFIRFILYFESLLKGVLWVILLYQKFLIQNFTGKHPENAREEAKVENESNQLHDLEEVPNIGQHINWIEVLVYIFSNNRVFLNPLFGPCLQSLSNRGHHLLNIKNLEPFNDPEELNKIKDSIELIFANMEYDVERY